jgi:hypothetical protein
MQKFTLIGNIVLAFVFFFIGRYLVQQMGQAGFLFILGLVAAFYLGWWYWRKKRGR